MLAEAWAVPYPLQIFRNIFFGEGGDGGRYPVPPGDATVFIKCKSISSILLAGAPPTVPHSQCPYARRYTPDAQYLRSTHRTCIFLSLSKFQNNNCCTLLTLIRKFFQI